MFWTDWKAGVVESSDMDGSGRSILASNLMWPNALAIDPPHQRIYWIEASTNTLESMKYDGTDRRVCTLLYGNAWKNIYYLPLFFFNYHPHVKIANASFLVPLYNS